MTEFEKGYKSFVEQAGAYAGGELYRISSQPYLDSIQKEINNLTNAMNKYQGNANPQLKGLVAETWHTHTFNIDAVAKQSAARATQLESNGLASVDVSTTWGDDYSLKFCKSGEISAMAQGHSLEYAYQRYIHNLKDGVEIPTRETYLKQNGFDPNTDMSLGMYEGQARLIPSDQIPDAIEALSRKIYKELNNLDNSERNKVAERLLQVKEKLTDHIESPDGAKSMPLTEQESRLLAEQSKVGNFDPERYDITLAQKTDAIFLCKNAMRAGLNAAWISALLKSVPELIRVIKKLADKGIVNKEDFERIGIAGVKGGVAGFFGGLICAFITSSSQLGYLGNAMRSATTSVNFAPSLAVCVVLLSEAVLDGYKCANGELTSAQYAYNIEKNLYIGVGGLAGGYFLQGLFLHIIEIPVVAYTLGSMIGSLLGGLVFSVKEHVMMSLCVKNGYRIFGLVEQDYTLPIKIRKKLGFQIYGYDEYEAREYKRQTYSYQTYQRQTYNWQTVDSIILKRGVIGFRKVGYM